MPYLSVANRESSWTGWAAGAGLWTGAGVAAGGGVVAAGGCWIVCCGGETAGAGGLLSFLEQAAKVKTTIIAPRTRIFFKFIPLKDFLYQ